MRLVRPLALGFVVWFVGCNSSQQNGQECLKNDDCESKRCIQYVCVDPASGKFQSDAATEAASDSAGDVADAATPDSPPGDATPTDTGAADTGTGDTGTADTGTSDTGTADTSTGDTGKTDTGTDAKTDADAAG
ncbi:MAG: hypothetical protein JNL79_38130 [Myxococcales bacterium]|nr:hypothetical protein [Myxococcales bacterium]